MVIITTTNIIQKQPPQVLYKKGVLRDFGKFTGKHLCQSLFLNKVPGLRPKACNFIKREILAQVFSCEFCKMFKNTSFTEDLQTSKYGGFLKFSVRIEQDQWHEIGEQDKQLLFDYQVLSCEFREISKNTYSH